MEIGEIPNYCKADWEGFCKELSIQLAKLPPTAQITTQRQMDTSCKNLMAAIQRTIETEIPVLNLTLKSKCWWMKELMQLCCLANKKGR